MHLLGGCFSSLTDSYHVIFMFCLGNCSARPWQDSPWYTPARLRGAGACDAGGTQRSTAGQATVVGQGHVVCPRRVWQRLKSGSVQKFGEVFVHVMSHPSVGAVAEFSMRGGVSVEKMKKTLLQDDQPRAPDTPQATLIMALPASTCEGPELKQSNSKSNRDCGDQGVFSTRSSTFLHFPSKCIL